MQDQRGKSPKRRQPENRPSGGQGQGGATPSNRREDTGQQPQQRGPRHETPNRDRDAGRGDDRTRMERGEEEDEVEERGRPDRDTDYWPRRHDPSEPRNPQEPYASD